jgi:hypothetical protein
VTAFTPSNFIQLSDGSSFGSQLRNIAPQVEHASAVTIGATTTIDISGSGAGTNVTEPPVEIAPRTNDFPVQ